VRWLQPTFGRLFARRPAEIILLTDREKLHAPRGHRPTPTHSRPAFRAEHSWPHAPERCAVCKYAVKLPLKRVGPIAESAPGWDDLEIGDRRSGVVMPTIETRLRQELRNYAVELRQLAYTLPNGVGEHDLLQLSARMHAASEQMVRKGA
jgi:hypothetical protein